MPGIPKRPSSPKTRLGATCPATYIFGNARGGFEKSATFFFAVGNDLDTKTRRTARTKETRMKLSTAVSFDCSLRHRSEGEVLLNRCERTTFGKTRHADSGEEVDRRRGGPFFLSSRISFGAQELPTLDDDQPFSPLVGAIFVHVRFQQRSVKFYPPASSGKLAVRALWPLSSVLCVNNSWIAISTASEQDDPLSSREHTNFTKDEEKKRTKISFHGNKLRTYMYPFGNVCIGFGRRKICKWPVTLHRDLACRTWWLSKLPTNTRVDKTGSRTRGTTRKATGSAMIASLCNWAADQSTTIGNDKVTTPNTTMAGEHHWVSDGVKIWDLLANTIEWATESGYETYRPPSAWTRSHASSLVYAPAEVARRSQPGRS